jgi:outer membrane receptor protein involved in Fe transport
MKKGFIGFLLWAMAAHAQISGGGRTMGNIGHFYGKVIDSITGKGIPFAAVQLSGQKWDSASNSMQTVVIAGQLTNYNGEFSLEKLPIKGPFTLQINTIGYRPYSQTVYFNLMKLANSAQKLKSNNAGDESVSSNSSSIQNLVNAIDRDLGNIRLAPDATQLKAVTIDGGTAPMELKLDKRVFDVSKSITSTGGTAEDVLKNIPAVNVDIDGNVTLRNASPTIYVDGMPTTLTIDQIPADEIDKIEVITNPSAKYDAQSSAGGIINIVMKKNRELGYNGTAKLGVDERGKPNAGLTLNLRQGKVNVFASVFYHGSDHIMNGITTRDNLYNPQVGSPLTDISEYDTNKQFGYFAMIRGGVDYFLDNRNTLTLSANYGRGDFATTDVLHTTTDTLHPGSPETFSSSIRNTNSTRTFNHEGIQLLYKHLFPKEGEDLTANMSLDEGASGSHSGFATQYYDMNNNPLGSQVLQQQITNGVNSNNVAKLDFTDPLTSKIKLETGTQISLNTVNNQTENSFYNNSAEEYEDVAILNSNFSFDQQIYAVYITLSHDVTPRLSYQIGLRAESSFYEGKYVDSAQSFGINYPLSLFPSAYITYHLTDKSDLQLNYSRHVTRPNFFQLVPYINYTDSLNITEGNPALRPQFTNSFEFNYLNTINKRNSFMVSLYYKYITGLITTLEEEQYSNYEHGTVSIYTYENANSANQAGAEVTSQNSIGNLLDITSNVNLYENAINGSNLNNSVNEQLLSWYAKLNLTFKLPAQFSIQTIGSYQSKSLIPINQGGGRWGGFGAPTTMPTAQGYILPIYSVDLAIKKDFFKNRALSITLSGKDILATAVSSTTSTTDFFVQNTSRKRDQQFFQINVSYRFGQTDFTLFKKKNMDMPDQSQDIQGGE